MSAFTETWKKSHVRDCKTSISAFLRDFAFLKNIYKFVTVFQNTIIFI